MLNGPPELKDDLGHCPNRNIWRDVDTRGAVELGLQTTAVTLPLQLTNAEARSVERWAGKSWDVAPDVWSQQQVLRLTLASVLEARLLHVQADRLGAFGLVADPSRVQIRQLAALHRAHAGTAGQAFELAVADACNSGVAAVIDPIRNAMRALGARAAEDVQVIVLGLEKIPHGRAEEFYDHLRHLLPEHGVLRTGKPGRPATAETVVRRLASSSWRTMASPKQSECLQQPTADSQLGRADALVICGPDLIAASFKINPTHIRTAWLHVPLWITTGQDTRVVSGSVGRLPLVRVELGRRQWVGLFLNALEILDRVLRAADSNHAPPLEDPHSPTPTDVLSRRLWAMRNRTIEEVSNELRRIHGGMQEIFLPHVSTQIRETRLEVLDHPEIKAAKKLESIDGALFTGQRHLFLPMPEG